MKEVRSVFSKINGKSVSNCYFALTEGKLSFSVIETFNFTTCFQSVKKLNVSKKLNVQKWNRNKLASEQTLRGALAAGREKEGELATTALEFEYLHCQSRCEMLIGGDDINIDVITLGACFHVFFSVCLHSRSFPLSADWRKSDSDSRDVVASSAPFSCRAQPRRACRQDSVKGTSCVMAV